jgi:hypothetical protein
MPSTEVDATAPGSYESILNQELQALASRAFIQSARARLPIALPLLRDSKRSNCCFGIR